jgi:hypothetical protein
LKSVDLEMQGVRLRIRTEYEDLIEYVRMHLPDHVVAETGQPHVQVNVQWHEGPGIDPDALLVFPGQEQLDRVGKRLLAGPDTLVWTNLLRIKNLVLRFQMQGEHLVIDAIYAYTPKASKIEAEPNYRYKKFFGLMSWFVFHPLAWYLEHFRGIYLMHASGIDIGGHGVVIGGVGGVGKTTTGVSLLAQDGTRLVSENLIFYDDTRIYSCYEPIRLDDQSVELLGARRQILATADIPDGANHKNVYHVRRTAVTESVEATALFVPRFTRHGYVKPLEVEPCMELLLAFNELTREVNDYMWYAATLNVGWPAARSLERRAATLRALLERVGRYELGIDRTQGVEPVVRTILERTGESARASFSNSARSRVS